MTFKLAKYTHTQKTKNPFNISLFLFLLIFDGSVISNIVTLIVKKALIVMEHAILQINNM